MDQNREKAKAETRLLRKTFNAKPKKWRIEAVIHDGSWYDIPKWAKIAKVTEEEVENWILEHGQYLVKSRIESYRTKYEDIISWYKKEGIELETRIVPNNFPPKVWTGATETEVFLQAPRRRAGVVSFVAKSPELLKKVKNILKGAAWVTSDGGEYKAYSLSAAHIRNLLAKGLEEEEYKSLSIKTRSTLLYRELSDLPEEWLEQALPFYSNIFVPSELKHANETLRIFLPDIEDRKSQITIWVILAMRKFDEEASVPFSGYLSNVLRYWPYDLPDEVLGKELARFQREKKRTINKLSLEHDEEDITAEILAEKMEISLEEYLTLNEEDKNWHSERSATTLNWDDSANEKSGQLLGVKPSIKSDLRMLYAMSLSTVKAAVDTQDWDSASLIISQIDNTNIDESLNDKLSPDFVAKFGEYLTSNDLTK